MCAPDVSHTHTHTHTYKHLSLHAHTHTSDSGYGRLQLEASGWQSHCPKGLVCVRSSRSLSLSRSLLSVRVCLLGYSVSSGVGVCVRVPRNCVPLLEPPSFGWCPQ